MGFPDRIERTVEIAHSPNTVWAALTSAEGLGTWFGEAATIDLRPGGAGQLRWNDGHITDLRVERVDEPTTFGFTCSFMVCPRTIPAAPTSSSSSNPLTAERG